MSRFYHFIHFHRVAGTSIIEMMKREGARFFQPNRNGNPSYTKGFWADGERALIPVWLYDGRYIRDFIHFCRENNWNAFATEFGFLREFPIKGLTHFTVIRDPWKRFLSTYNFSRWAKFRVEGLKNFTIKKFYQSHGVESYDNYYTRMLSRRYKNELSHSDFKVASSILEKITVIILEDKQTWKNLDEIGLSSDLPHHHSNQGEFYKRDAEFEKRWKKENEIDYQLYKRALEFSS